MPTHTYEHKDTKRSGWFEVYYNGQKINRDGHSGNHISTDEAEQTMFWHLQNNLIPEGVAAYRIKRADKLVEFDIKSLQDAPAPIPDPTPDPGPVPDPDPTPDPPPTDPGDDVPVIPISPGVGGGDPAPDPVIPPADPDSALLTDAVYDEIVASIAADPTTLNLIIS